MSNPNKAFGIRLLAVVAVALLIWGVLRLYPPRGQNQTALAEDKSAAEAAQAQGGRSSAGAEPKRSGSLKPLADADEDEPQGDPKMYDLPKTDKVADLMEFMDRIGSFRPTSRGSMMLHREKAPEALKAAAERILTLEKDKSSEAYRTADALMMMIRLSTIPEASPAQRKALVADVAQRLSTPEPGPEYVALAMKLTRLLGQIDDTELAAQANREFGEALANAKDERLAKLAEMFAAAARRLDLPGHPMKVEGVPVSGGTFDWESYRGKVVLVDFWATWCGPCRAELPNVQRAYKAYHDRGFDVVGVSVDDNDAALDKFVAAEKLPWVTLRDKPAGAGEEEGHPLSTYYGIEGIPTVILVGRDGNVVSLHARGPELWKLLEALIGPAPAGNAKNPADEPDAKSAAEDDDPKPDTDAKPDSGLDQAAGESADGPADASSPANAE